jgi:hypothetical protein
MCKHVFVCVRGRARLCVARAHTHTHTHTHAHAQAHPPPHTHTHTRDSEGSAEWDLSDVPLCNENKARGCSPTGFAGLQSWAGSAALSSPWCLMTQL